MEERVERKRKVAYVGNSILGLGFKIAGVTESHHVRNTTEAEAAFRDLLARDDMGILVVSSAAKRMVRDRRLLGVIEESLMPLIVQVPEKDEDMTEEETLRRLILRAIGIDISRMFKK